MSNEQHGQQNGTITWIEYDRENPPAPEALYLVTDGYSVAIQMGCAGRVWFDEEFEPYHFAENDVGGIPDREITHYAYINLPEVQE